MLQFGDRNTEQLPHFIDKAGDYIFTLLSTNVMKKKNYSPLILDFTKLLHPNLLIPTEDVNN